MDRCSFHLISKVKAYFCNFHSFKHIGLPVKVHVVVTSSNNNNEFNDRQ